MMTRSVNQEIVNDTTKLLMHRLVARLLARDPELVECARRSLAATARRFPERTFVREWESLLLLPVSSLRKLLISRDEDMRRLRLSSPFVIAEGVDFTDLALRRKIMRAAKRIAGRTSMRGNHRIATAPASLRSGGN